MLLAGIITVLQADKYLPVVNISTDESNSVLDLARIACKVVGKDVEICHDEDRKGQVRVAHFFFVLLSYF